MHLFLNTVQSMLGPQISDDKMRRVEKRAFRNVEYRRAAGSTDGKAIKPYLPAVHSILAHYSHRNWAVAAALTWTLGKKHFEEPEYTAVVSTLEQVLQSKFQSLRHVLHLAAEYMIRLLPISVPLAIHNTWCVARGENTAPLAFMIFFCYFWTLGSIAAASGLLAPFFGPILVIVSRRRINFVRAVAAWSLGSLQHAHATHALLIASHDSSRQVRDQARTALHKVVPAFLKCGGTDLDTAAIRALCKLVTERDGKLVLTALSILEPAGDVSALPAVRRAAESSSLEVAIAAARVLDILEARGKQELQRKQLLRATNPDSENNVLLRATVSTISKNYNILLR